MSQKIRSSATCSDQHSKQERTLVIRAVGNLVLSDRVANGFQIANDPVLRVHCFLSFAIATQKQAAGTGALCGHAVQNL